MVGERGSFGVCISAERPGAVCLCGSRWLVPTALGSCRDVLLSLATRGNSRSIYPRGPGMVLPVPRGPVSAGARLAAPPRHSRQAGIWLRDGLLFHGEHTLERHSHLALLMARLQHVNSAGRARQARGRRGGSGRLEAVTAGPQGWPSPPQGPLGNSPQASRGFLGLLASEEEDCCGVGGATETCRCRQERSPAAGLASSVPVAERVSHHSSEGCRPHSCAAPRGPEPEPVNLGFLCRWRARPYLA